MKAWEPYTAPNSALFALGLDDFFAPVKTVGADVVAQMHLACDWLDGQRRIGQKVVRAMHAALGRGFLVLLYCHDKTPFVNSARVRPV